MTNNSSNGNGNSTNGAASGWLGFSLSPYMASAMDDHHHHHHHVQQQQQQQQQHGLFFPSVTAAAAAYGLGAGDAVATSASPYYTPQLASMPLKSDGSLCIMEALRRSDQDHHGMRRRSIHFLLVYVLDSRIMCACLMNRLIDRQGRSSRTSWARRSRRPWR